MKILLTNDDGIYAPGLWAAVRALREVGDVFVVAPDRQQSGVGASLTLHSPLRVRAVPVEAHLGSDGTASSSVTAYAVEGTPGDSCVLALEAIVGPVHLVVSGINAGSNLGVGCDSVGDCWRGDAGLCTWQPDHRYFRWGGTGPTF